MRKLDRRAFPAVYVRAVEALGSFGGADAVEALKQALYAGEWTAPLRTRRTRAVAAQALRRIGNAAAIAALEDSSANGPRGARSAAKTELKRLR